MQNNSNNRRDREVDEEPECIGAGGVMNYNQHLFEEFCRLQSMTLNQSRSSFIPFPSVSPSSSPRIPVNHDKEGSKKAPVQSISSKHEAKQQDQQSHEKRKRKANDDEDHEYLDPSSVDDMVTKKNKKKLVEPPSLPVKNDMEKDYHKQRFPKCARCR